MPDPTLTARQTVHRWDGAKKADSGADVVCWMTDDEDRPVGSPWLAKIRWQPDDTTGHFVMRYPNPNGGDDVVIDGRTSVNPLVSQALKIGRAAVAGSGG